MTYSTPRSRRTGPTLWLATLGLFLLPTAARAALSDMRFTEIAHSPATEGGSQWVELMNAGEGPAVVNGLWIGADNSGRAVPLSGLAPVPPGGFLVIRWNGGSSDLPTRAPTSAGASQE